MSKETYEPAEIRAEKRQRRERIATAVLAGMSANSVLLGICRDYAAENGLENDQTMAKFAVGAADALIAELDK